MMSTLRHTPLRESASSARRVLILALLACAAPAVPSAAAAAPAPGWLLTTEAAPADFHPGDTSDFYELVAVNDGGAPSSGPITFTDTLPPGVTVNAIVARSERLGVSALTEGSFGPCGQSSNEEVITVTCSGGVSVPVGRSIKININLQVPAGIHPPASVTNVFTLAGGGAKSASQTVQTPVTEASTAVPFGASLTGEATRADGTIDTQAGSHPFAFTTLLGFNVGRVEPNESCNENNTLSCAEPTAQPKDLEVALPAGLVGNPTAVPRCKHAEFERQTFAGCPASTQVGDVHLLFYGKNVQPQASAVYNIEPPPGQPAELGFSVSTLAHVPIFFHVRSDGDYGLTTDFSQITQTGVVRMALLSIWGEPSDPAHDPLRESEPDRCVPGCPSGVANPKPFLTLPTSCSAAPLPIITSGDSWQEPEAAPFAKLSEATIPALAGCEALQFHPTLEVTPSTPQAGAPAAYNVGVTVPQNEEPGALTTPDVRDVEVALPQGTVLSPSGANGLTACTEAQFQRTVRAPGNCPGSSKVATVAITTPLLANPLKGSLYVGEPECSPCSPAASSSGQLVHLYLQAQGSGVTVKLDGHTRIDQATGQLTTVFLENPQLPFSHLEVSVEGGPNAPLVNPATCGPATAIATVTPWSATTPATLNAPAFPVEGCGSQAFSPTLQAGTSPTAHAGAFTGFTMTLSRADGQQTLGQISITMPPGLLGVLKSVEQCPDAQANAGSCAAGSLIGAGSIVVGPGLAPLTISGSRVYFTGPYGGKPFGLSIVTPAKAGPFLLAGNTGSGNEVVRASIAVDKRTGAVTVTSDPLPQQLNGVPLDVRSIHIDINRGGFLFSPTNCNAMAMHGAVASSTGTVANLSSPFQATDCGILPFKPKFAVSTQGNASKANGASLHVRVTSGAGQANIAKVKVNLPLQLPSRLSTLQKACVDSMFEANPGSCPAASVVGQATAVTPLLAHHLTGPAYLVSHAGAAFPDLEIVLQGEGITLILDGNTQIKKGITSSIFRAVPDAPISSFDLALPEGPHSVLATNLPAKAKHNLCGQTLNMPTVITGQNGAVVRQTTRVAATGCPKRKPQGKSKKH